MLDLGLKGSELLAYALIWGFCQDGESDFHGSSAYVAHWCGISRQQAVAVLKKLTDCGHVIKSGAPGYPAHYHISTDEGVNFLGVSNNLTGGVNLPDTGCQVSLPPAPLYNDRHNKDIIKTPPVSPRTREDDKILYGENVRLTADEHAKLVTRFGADDTARLVEILDGYLSNPKQRNRYANHYRAILGWPVQRLTEEKLTQQRLQNSQEAAQRVNAPKAPETHYADLAEIEARRKAIEDKYKN